MSEELDIVYFHPPQIDPVVGAVRPVLLRGMWVC